MGKRMSNRELVDAAIELAGEFYAMQGYSHRPGFEYWKSPHPHVLSHAIQFIPLIFIGVIPVLLRGFPLAAIAMNNPGFA